jgi:hypothetical protein
VIGCVGAAVPPFEFSDHASPQAACIAGAIIPVDGGWSANGAAGLAAALHPAQRGD